MKRSEHYLFPPNQPHLLRISIPRFQRLLLRYQCAWRYGLSTFLLFLAVVVQSTVFSQSPSLVSKDLLRRSDVVAVGKVVHTRSTWMSNRSYFVMYVTLRVSEHLKSARNERELVVAAPGGEIDGIRELYTHAAEFSQEKTLTEQIS